MINEVFGVVYSVEVGGGNFTPDRVTFRKRFIFYKNM